MRIRSAFQHQSNLNRFISVFGNGEDETCGIIVCCWESGRKKEIWGKCVRTSSTVENMDCCMTHVRMAYTRVMNGIARESLRSRWRLSDGCVLVRIFMSKLCTEHYVLQCVAVCFEVCCIMLQCQGVCWSCSKISRKCCVLQCAAVCCSALQCRCMCSWCSK